MPDTAERERFICANMGLVHSLARRFLGRGIEYEELVQAGSLGLIKAFNGFDASRGLQFSTYAVPVIMGEMKKLFRDGGTVKVSRQLKEYYYMLLRAEKTLTERSGAQPTINELAEFCCLTKSQAVEALTACRAPLSFTAEEGEDSRELSVPVPCCEERISEIISLNSAIAVLSEQDQLLLSLRFVNNLTQTDVAQKLGTTQVQISRRERRIIDKLRDTLIS